MATEEGKVALKQFLSNDEMMREACRQATLEEIIDFGVVLLEGAQVADSEEEKEMLEHAWEVTYEEALKIRNTMSDDECMEWLKANFFDIKEPKECN